MEGNLSGGNLISNPSYGVLDPQGSMHLHQHSLHPHHHHMQEIFPLSVGPQQISNAHENDQSLALVDFKNNHRGSANAERGKACTSDEEEPSYTEDGFDGHLDGGKGKKNSPWQRMKWTYAMVKLLITIVSYIGEDIASSECSGGGGGRRKLAILQKKGKWKSVSKVMAQRGCYVSPQQCEDKFNDLNKRYKRLTDVLGRGTSCKVVENPMLLETMDHLSEKTKEDVRKILSSKHLFYEEMCSYHNGNRLHLLEDPSLQQSLLSVLKGRDSREKGKFARDENDGDDQDEDDIDEGDDEGDENNNMQGEDGLFGGAGHTLKRFRLINNLEDASFWANSHDCGKRSEHHNTETSEVVQDSAKAAWIQRQLIRNRTLQLEEQRLNIQVRALELENQWFKWQKFRRKKDRELERLKLENEKMKLENERMLLELKHKELELEYNRPDASMAPIDLLTDRVQRREQSELERGQCIR